MRRPGRLTVTRRAGFTIVELMIALVMAGIVMGAVYQLLAKNQRFYRAQSQITEVQQNIRAVAAILPGDMRELAASGGDIVSMGDSAITFRAMRSFNIICAPPNPGTGAIIVYGNLAFGYRALDPARDSLLVFRDGDSSMASDDRWILGGLGSITLNAGLCTDGTTGTTVRMTGANTALLDSVRTGSPLRGFEHVHYEYYDDGSGQWWLGVQTMSGGAWGALTPVAGPLLPGGGLDFNYYDANGNATNTPSQVAAIEIAVKGRSQQQLMVEGRPRGFFEDSLRVRVALRNN